MAKRDKLTKNQKRLVAKNRKDVKLAGQSEHLSHLKEGLIVSRFGNQADVLDKESNEIYRCYLRQHIGAPVPGDKVSFRIDSVTNEKVKGIIEFLTDRISILERPSQHKGVKPIVANIDLIFVVIAPLPDFSSILLDRYLIATRCANIETIIVLNKSDLIEEINNQKIEDALTLYKNIGYPIVKISSISNQGKHNFSQLAKNKSSILVGQSGVGKSSIINWLFPNEDLPVQSISENSRLGQHTTTTSKIYPFKEKVNGYLVDSPGIREFGLWHLNDEQIAQGYVEFEDYLGTCKFRDCHHTNEPGCAIIDAVKNNRIDARRWQNYVKIIKNNQTP